MLDTLAIEQAHVVGLSLSGAIAIQLASAAPERVRTLTLIEPPPVHVPNAAAFRATNTRPAARQVDPRLTAHLRCGAKAKLTLVSSPAGFGKTTLLADRLGKTPDDNRSKAWLSLDPADNEPASFWTYVATALQGAGPGVGSNALELITSAPLPTDLVLTTLLNELAAAPGEVWLALDDFHW